MMTSLPYGDLNLIVKYFIVRVLRGHPTMSLDEPYAIVLAAATLAGLAESHAESFLRLAVLLGTAAGVAQKKSACQD
jgi:hypothetical protein